jgi:plasmid stability protein
MPATKTETLTCRIAPEVKAALRAAAAREHRSLANMLEVMVLRYTERENTPAPSKASCDRGQDWT